MQASAFYTLLKPTCKRGRPRKNFTYQATRKRLLEASPIAELEFLQKEDILDYLENKEIINSEQRSYLSYYRYLVRFRQHLIQGPRLSQWSYTSLTSRFQTKSLLPYERETTFDKKRIQYLKYIEGDLDRHHPLYRPALERGICPLEATPLIFLNLSPLEQNLLHKAMLKVVYIIKTAPSFLWEIPKVEG